MGTKLFLFVLLFVGISNIVEGYPRSSDSDSDEDTQQQQQQNIDSDSLEEFTQKIQSIKGQRKPEKVQKEEEPEAYDPCLDAKRIGQCKARIPRYYFNKDSGNCEIFPWGGCGKNGNNFKELSECESSCEKHLTKNDKLEKHENIDPSSLIATCEDSAYAGRIACQAYIPRWTYNSSSLQCEQFIWGGCAKTKNNFASESACKDACGQYPIFKDDEGEIASTTVRTNNPPQSGRDLGQNVCNLPSESGFCLAYFEKYYFNKLRNRCEVFAYGGCGGNGNRFDTAEDCVKTCGGSAPTKALECTNVECPWVLYDQYESLGCSPIFDGDGCCPTRYECPDRQHDAQNNTLDSRSLTLEREETEGTTSSPELPTMPSTCRYKGKMYKVGEYVDEASDGGSCRAGCICTGPHGDSGPRIICAQVECRENFGGPPRGKENCIPLYKKGACCAYDYHCPEGELTVIDPDQRQPTNGNKPSLAKCTVDGETVYEGQRIFPDKSPCSKCLCEKNPANATSPEGQLYCEKVDCGIEIYYSHYLAQGCSPVYYERSDGSTSCCPITWECPDIDQQESDNETTTSTTPETSNPEEPEPPKPPSTDSPLPPTLLSPSPPSPPDTDISGSSLTRSQDACSMEKLEGDCKGQRPRFFYNGETQKCESFIYTGCKGNLNNFASLDDCKNLCESNSMTISSVQPSPPAKGGKTRGGLLSRTRGIDDVTGTQQPEMRAISLTEVDSCTLPKRVGRCKGYFPRFYYSPEENECKLFIFGGCRPNANNFYSKDSCEATCLNKIPVENLRTNIPAALAIPTVERRMGGGGGDSSRVNFADDKFILVRTVPKPPRPFLVEADPCILPPRTGRCKAYVRRFYYDTDQKKCKVFTYGGCSGNDNNFQTMADCDERCGANKNIESASVQGSDTVTGPGGRNSPSIPAVDLYARCKLPKSPGSCYASIRSYYYDVETKSCKLFFYSGCFGNANRFITQDDCVNECKKPLETEGGSTANEETINQPARPRIHELSESTTEGSIEERGERDFCKKDPSPGNCKENQLRYYYDSVAEQCLPFVFSGCNGNQNNFLTEAECMSSCGNKPTLEQLAQEMVLSCTFGNKNIPLGSTVGKTDDYSGEEPPCGVPVCQCITPPAVTCIQKLCPVPTTTTTTTTSESPTEVCLPIFCRKDCKYSTGDDGCPTCNCDDQSQTGSGTKQIPVKSVKG